MMQKLPKTQERLNDLFKAERINAYRVELTATIDTIATETSKLSTKMLPKELLAGLDNAVKGQIGTVNDALKEIPKMLKRRIMAVIKFDRV